MEQSRTAWRWGMVLSGLILFSGSAAEAQGPKGGKGGQGGQANKGGLMGGLQIGGQAAKQGIGEVVKTMTHQGVHGQQLAALIHQLKGKGKAKGKGGMALQQALLQGNLGGLAAGGIGGRGGQVMMPQGLNGQGLPMQPIGQGGGQGKGKGKGKGKN